MRALQSLPVAAIAMAASLALSLALPVPAMAQTNPVIDSPIPKSEALNVQAKITAIDRASRAVTLAGASGQQTTITAGPLVRLELLKVGDSVNVKYYRSVAFAVNGPSGGDGTPTSDNQMSELVARSAHLPGGVGVRLIKVQGTVVGIDLATHSVDLVNPSGGGVYTLHVTDPTRAAALGSLKVGDTVTAVISQAVAVTIESAPKHWF